MNRVLDEYRQLYPDALWITGACVGVDEWAAIRIHAFCGTVYTVVPADRDKVHKDFKLHCSVYELMQFSCGNNPSKRFMARNNRMIAIARFIIPSYIDKAICLAFPDEPETLRSGTWATVRRARRADMVPVVTQL